MAFVLDAGALLAVERAHRDTIALLKEELSAGRVPLTHAGVVGQVWRGGHGRQTMLARFLPGVRIAALDESLGQRAGLLLGRARRADVMDAALVLLASDGDTILTSDVDDVKLLVRHASLHVDIVRV